MKFRISEKKMLFSDSFVAFLFLNFHIDEYTWVFKLNIPGFSGLHFSARIA